MEMKKSPSKDVHQKAPLFMAIGLCLSLLLVITAFEWNFNDDGNQVDLYSSTDIFEELVDIPPTYQPPPPPPAKQQLLEIIEVEDDEEIEEIRIELDIEITEDDLIEEIIFEESVEEEESDEIMTIVEVMPSPIGGYEKFYKFIAETMVYPMPARRAGVEGKLILELVIGKKGELIDAKVVRGIGFGCDKEALRVMGLWENWNPGKQRGRPVITKFYLPLKFQID